MAMVITVQALDLAHHLEEITQLKAQTRMSALDHRRLTALKAVQIALV